MMIEKHYPVAFEIEGRAAMFARPDTGSSPISYPVIPAPAAKCIFEAVAFSKDAYFVPMKVEICSPIVYHKYATNHGGPSKKSGKINFQFFSTILENVCYKIYGEIKAYHPPLHGYNPQHMLQEVFLRRLSNGCFYTTPFLGCKEFIPTYFGVLRESTTADDTVNMILPSLSSSVHSKPTNGEFSPRYVQNVEIEKGVMIYSQ